MNLSKKELLVTLCVEHHVERASGCAFQPGVKAGFRVRREPVKKNAQGVAGIEMSYSGIPLRPDGRIRLSHQIRGAELAKQFARGIVREANITVAKFLIEDGSAEKSPHLLFFDRFARRRQNVTAPGKDSARNLPIERGEKRERPLFKGENGISTPQLDVMGGSEAINIGGIDTQRLNRIIQFMR